ncbi:M48 family metallopeptidase [Candidatus Saccharibacteria bacterium]|nr:M48 family metallopeptidase [Candidatus Saccharibacteria bacterium]
MEQRKFRYGKRTYDYVLERSNRKTFSLVVFPNMRISLRVPLDVSDSDINGFLVKKWSWLEKQLREFNRYKKNQVIKSYVSGENFYYLGRQYMLRVEKNPAEGIGISPGVITIKTRLGLRNSNHNKAIYEKWYLKKCESVFKRELISAIRDYDIDTIPKLKIREMKTRWGSYQKNNTINLNPKLLQAPKAAIRYVITHELCHIECKNHDKDFFTLLESRVPNWKKIKDELELKYG